MSNAPSAFPLKLQKKAIEKKKKSLQVIYFLKKMCYNIYDGILPSKNQLKAGRKIDVNELSRLQLESEKNVALDKALTFISLTRKTEKQVRDFLSGKGYLADVIEYVVEKMSGYKFLDDGDYAKAYVEQTATKKGSRLIKLELKAKGVDEQEIENAFDGVKEDTQINAAKRILEKYMRGKCADRETLAKSFRYLLGKGFEYDVAKSAISAYGECDDE